MAHELDILKGQRNYKGTIVVKMIGNGYQVFGIHCETPSDVDLIISQAGKAIEGSLKVTVDNSNGAFTAQNDVCGRIG